VKPFTTFLQHNQMDCGPTCLRMIAQHYGRKYSLESLRRNSGINREGVSLLGISEAAENIGFRTVGAKLSWEQISTEAPLPCIVHWNQEHFVVVYKIRRDKVYIADPAKGKVTYSKSEFLQCWLSTKNNGQSTGIALLLYTTPKFFELEDDRKDHLDFIYIILIAQVMLFIGRTGVEFLRSWILLHMSTRINISILSDFLIKLMKLPMPYFDSRMTGDIMQRMEDHRRIQDFLTSKTLSTLFSFVTLFVFAGVLAYYNMLIFVIFLVSSVLYVIWVLLFLKKRAELDHRRFGISSGDQSTVIQLIQGMQEIKLTNSEKQKRWDWEKLQAKLFHYQVKNLSLNQTQQAGAFFINEGKNIGITFIAAVAVVNGQLTLGAMMAVQYIIGQLNGPIQQLIGFVQSAQDAQLSMERLNEVHKQEDEEPKEKHFSYQLPPKKEIQIRNLTFTYPGAGNEPVLNDIDLVIPEGKTTAIVGMSGSGKTTLLKLLLKFYPPDKGEIRIGNQNLDFIRSRTFSWLAKVSGTAVAIEWM